MKKTSLIQLATEPGISASYLSQVKNGKRPPSDKLLSNVDIRRMLTGKQNGVREYSHTYPDNPLNNGQRRSAPGQKPHTSLVF